MRRKDFLPWLEKRLGQSVEWASRPRWHGEWGPAALCSRRWHATLKGESFRRAAPETVDEARRVVTNFVQHYNEVRLHSALGYITPTDKLAGLEKVIAEERDRKFTPATTGCLKSVAARATTKLTWAEDRAPVRTDPSADSGPRPKDGRPLSATPPALHSFGIGVNAINLRGRCRDCLHRDVCDESLANTRPRVITTCPTTARIQARSRSLH